MEKKIKNSELWELSYTIAEFILPRLIAFRKMERTSYPISFKTLEEWNETLDKMIFAFQEIVDDPALGYKKEEIARKKITEGLKLFSEHFEGLWD